MQPGEIIGRGRTADIYKYGPWAFKWLHAPFAGNAEVFNEVVKALAASRAGARSPQIIAVLEHGGRPGILFERLSGPAMLDVIMSKWWQVGRLGRQLAELHASLHAASVPGLDTMHQRLQRAIERNPRLDAQLKSGALGVLERMPQGSSLCHGDFHPGNVMFHHGQAMVVDWVDASQGNPLADVARTQMLFLIPRLPLDGLMLAILQRLRGYMLNVYLREYFRLRPEGREQLDDWMTVILAARLAERVEGEEELLLAELRKRLS